MCVSIYMVRELEREGDTSTLKGNLYSTLQHIILSYTPDDSGLQVS